MNLVEDIEILLRKSHGDGPIYRVIYARIRESILKGTLKPGARLPSSRVLAEGVSVSRGTVELAYSHLISEGYLVSRGRTAGTVVNPAVDSTLLGRMAHGKQPTRPVPGPPGTLRAHRPLPLPSFKLGLPALDAFPRKLWSRVATRRARSLSAADMMVPDASGYQPLRVAIANHLTLFRGVSCAAEEILITTGFQAALGLICSAMLHPGDAVWMEDPGYFRARDCFQSASAVLMPVPVDEEGLVVSEGKARNANARLVYTTPSHQAPLGCLMSLPRKVELLSWATQAGAWIVEDDYDGEFRYDGWPAPALKSLDSTGRVFYVGSFSKVLFPGLRLGYLVAPEEQLQRLRRTSELHSPGPATLDQAILADFMSQGHFARHIQRMRHLYSERSQALVGALSAECGKWLEVGARTAGLHLLLWLKVPAPDAAVADHVRSHGLDVLPLSQFVLGREANPGLLLGFTNVPAETATGLTQRLARALQSYFDKS